MKFNRTYFIEAQGVDGEWHYFTTPLSLDFTVQQGVLQVTQVASFRLYNISPLHRDVLYRDPIDLTDYREIIFRAGYGRRETMPIVFSGYIRSCHSYRAVGTTEYITEIECIDGIWAKQKAYSSFTESEGSKQNVVERLISDLSAYNVTAGAIGEITGDYPRGITCVGNTVKLLQEITDGKMFISDGKVYILNENEAVNKGVAVIDSKTGLLGTPRQSGVQIRLSMIFEPNMRPGQMIDINSSADMPYLRKGNGRYKVYGIVHNGTISDAVSGKCTTNINSLLSDNLIEVDE